MTTSNTTQAQKLADWLDGGTLADDSVEWGNKLEEAASMLRDLEAENVALKKDAERYHWLKLAAPPGEPLELLNKMREAHHLVKAYEVFCTGWTGWDKVIDTARASLSTSPKERA